MGSEGSYRAATFSFNLVGVTNDFNLVYKNENEPGAYIMDEHEHWVFKCWTPETALAGHMLTKWKIEA